MIYKLFLVANFVALAIAAAFFIIGLSDGSVSSFNIAVWTMLLVGLSGVLLVGKQLKLKGKSHFATSILGITAIPTILGGLFMLIVLVTQPRWN